mgnify:CR=1 FL=1
MAGLKVVVSAGGTREHLDPVRFLGNSSSGLMGWALARAAVLRGADVSAWSRPTCGCLLRRARRSKPVSSTADLAQAMAVGRQGCRYCRDGGGASRLHARPRPVRPRSRRPADGWHGADAGPDHRRTRQPCSGQNRPAPGPGRLRRRNPQSRDRRCWIWGGPSLRARAATCWSLNEVGPNLGLRPAGQSDNNPECRRCDRTDRRKQRHTCASNLG